MLKVHSFRMRKRFTVGVVFLCTAFVSSFSQAQPGQNPNSLPPGLQKKVEEGKPLPPGWERKLEIGGYLDRDIYRRADVLYRDREEGRVTVRIEGKVIRLIENSLEIVDILNDL
ncbi:hypothetical protein GCM10011403_05570 [Pseudohongiella nitratireducens]|jgi:hypothetical protein|uniref:Uncharacterized protein n=1 Tax=Pseudohongiella nitratireducens TaxID=1768907 RepID=A0A917GMK3_9GAMM|nr:hypothetical protein [Pseudohongiella nitratireducens]MDF1622117.1 hypothetical protein [Pseudohongiella nitratireducens]GGG51294.1 hypothetical protein GCM10011403_05570 [Pseudohongiella nitratireducens]